jgi:hypothetical protein
MLSRTQEGFVRRASRFELVLAAGAVLVSGTAAAQPAANMTTQRTDAREAELELPPPDDPPVRSVPRRHGWAVGVDVSAVGFTAPPIAVVTDARFGYRFNFPHYFLVPEVMVGYAAVPGGGDVAHAGRWGGGVRIGTREIASILETSFFSHIGIIGNTHGALPCTDLGVSLDLRAGRFFSAGAHLAWDLAALGSGGWVPVSQVWLYGVHAGLVL